MENIHNGEKFYAFHNARLYDENGVQSASIEEIMFLSKDVTDLSEEEIACFSKEMYDKYKFSSPIMKEEDGRMYAVYQMFDNEYDAKNFLSNYLGDKFEECYGIFECITHDCEMNVETAGGIVKMKGTYVDNYYLKRTKGKS
jgi:hypothetical protein